MDPYLTIEDVKAAMHCSANTIRRYVASGELPASRAGKRLLFAPEDVRAFMRRRQVRPRAVPA